MAACGKPVVTHDETLYFGDVPLGTSRTLSLELRSPGPATTVALATDDARFTVSATEVSVPANGAATVDVTFNATALGPVEASLAVGESSVTLRGRGVGAALEVVEEVLLGTLPLVRGEPTPSFPVPLRVRNAGTAPSKLTVTVTSDDAELCVGATCAPWTMPLEAGVSADVPLVVRPTMAGTRAWTVRVASEATTRIVIVRALVDEFEPCQLVTPTALMLRGSAAVLEMTHTGAGRCVVKDLTLSSFPPPTPLMFDTPPSLPMVMQSGVTRTIGVTTTRPPPSTLDGGLVRIVPGGAPAIEIPITIEPNTAPSCLVLSPSALDFGVVAQGCQSATRTVVVHNTCGWPVTMSAPQLSDSSFVLVAGPGSAMEIGPGGNTMVQLRFVPTHTGSVSAALSVSAGGLDYLLGLTARGDQRSQGSDTYRVPVRPHVDWVVMVDTSPSFAPKLPAVRANLQTMLSRVHCVDARVAFAHADGAADAGVTFTRNDAGAEWTSNGDVDFVDRALSAFDALPESSETEACIGPAAALAQSVPVIDGGIFNGLCITDSLEQSPNPTAALQSFRSGRSSSFWSTVVGNASSPCAIEAADDGVHASLKQSANGLAGDICDATWASTFATGIVECGQRTQFFLSSLPGGAALDVRVDGQPVTGWTFDAANNVVVFQPNTAPPPGSTLTISYIAACQP